MSSLNLKRGKENGNRTLIYWSRNYRRVYFNVLYLRQNVRGKKMGIEHLFIGWGIIAIVFLIGIICENW